MKRTDVSKEKNRLKSIKNIEEMNNLFYIKPPKLTRVGSIEIELRKSYSGGVFPRGLYTTLSKEYGCTRQRIEQIASKLFPDRIKRTDDRFKHECRVCERLVSGIRLFCSRGHYIEYSNNLPVVMCGDCEKRPARSLGLCERCYQSYRYHTVAGVKEKHNIAMREYMSSPGVRLKFKERQKEYIRKYMETPKGKAAAKTSARAFYDRKRNDPVRWAKFLEKSREYQRNRYWLIKLNRINETITL